MQSSYKVIKNYSVNDQGSVQIVTQVNSTQNEELKETNAKIFIESYEALARTMLENARLQADSMLRKAYEEARILEEEASEKGYKEGLEKGYSEGYNEGYNKAYEEGYEKNMQIALAEGEKIKNNADSILNSCKAYHDNYLIEKENEIRNIIFNIVESVLKAEVKDKDGLNSMIYDALNYAKNSKSIVIKINSLYADALKEKVDDWKKLLPYKGDMFIIEDNSIEDGTAIIERESGMIKISIDSALEKIKEVIFEN